MSIEMNLNEEESKLRQQLQRAVRSTEAPQYLESKIRANIRTSGARQPLQFRYSWMAAAAALAVVVSSVIAYQLGHLRLTASSQESYIASVSNHVASIMRVGLRDHLHCAYFRKYPKDAPKLENIEGKLGKPYRGMIPIVRKHAPADFQVMMTHHCSYQGRDFVHLTLRRGSQLLSVVLAVKQDGESFKTELPEAYERLILDALRGDSTLFMRSDEIDYAWQIATAIAEEWKDAPPPSLYRPGTWGPPEADRLFETCAGKWRTP